MSELDNKPYGVSYIASAPDELKVGDRVEIVGTDDKFEGETGEIKTISEDAAGVNLDSDKGYLGFSLCYLRKLPDTMPCKGCFESAHGKNNPMDRQVGGSHYKDMAIQPIEFSMKNGLNACQHSIIKYVVRYKNKNGKEDLLKAKHFIDLLIQMEYPE